MARARSRPSREVSRASLASKPSGTDVALSGKGLLRPFHCLSYTVLIQIPTMSLHHSIFSFVAASHGPALVAQSGTILH